MSYLSQAFSLSENGGIYYQGARIKPTTTKWLLVGVGGMGTDTLVRVKNEVMQRMEIPMHDGIPTGAPPANIKFVAIDTEKDALKAMHCSSTKFSQSEMEFTRPPEGSSWQNIVDNYVHAKQMGHHYAQFMPDGHIDCPGGGAAGAMRLMGRLGLFANAQNVINKINSALVSLGGAADVNICLFAGISGGTGSGSFIDLAFLLKQLTTGTSQLSAFLYMDDLNENDPGSKTDRARNAYAALKEMNEIIILGEKKKNEPYRFGNTHTMIEYRGNPFDYAYIINRKNTVAGTYEKGRIVSDVAESVFQLVSDRTAAGAGAVSGMMAINNNAASWFVSNKNHGLFPSVYRYMSTCASFYKIPYIEINTLVVSRMFAQLNNPQTGGVFTNSVTADSFARDLQALGISPDLPNRVDSRTVLSAVMRTLLDKIISDIAPITRELKTWFSHPDGYTIDQIWHPNFHGVEDTRPWKDVYTNVANYQHSVTGIAAPQVSTFEGKLKEYLGGTAGAPESGALVGKSKGPFYLAKLLGPVGNGYNIIALLTKIKEHADGLVTQESIKANNIKRTLNETYREGDEGNSRDKRRLAEDFIKAIKNYENACRASWLYDKLSEMCAKMIEICAKYYNNIIGPLTKYLGELSEIFGDNLKTLAANHAALALEGRDPHVLIYPMDFEQKNANNFAACVNNAKNQFLLSIKENLYDWVGCTIENPTPDPNYTNAIAYRLSACVSMFFDKLYGTVSMDSIYQDKITDGTPFNVFMGEEIINMYDQLHPLYNVDSSVDIGATVQEYAILFVPKSAMNIIAASNIITSAAGPGPMHGKMHLIQTEDNSCITMIKVGEGYTPYGNSRIAYLEDCYAGDHSLTKHLDYRWKNYPNPYHELTWGVGHTCQETRERNERYRKIFDKLHARGRISLVGDQVKFTYGHVNVNLGEEDDPDKLNLAFVKLTGDINNKKTTLRAIEEQIWSSTKPQVKDLDNIGTYGGGDKIINARESCLLDYSICEMLDKENEVYTLYDRLEASLTFVRSYVYAWLCSMFEIDMATKDIKVRYSAHDPVPTTIVRGGMTPHISTDDDFYYVVYNGFYAIKDDIPSENKSWIGWIEQNWKVLSNLIDRDVEQKKAKAKGLGSLLYAFEVRAEKFAAASRLQVSIDNAERLAAIADFYSTCYYYGVEIDKAYFGGLAGRVVAVHKKKAGG